MHLDMQVSSTVLVLFIGKHARSNSIGNTARELLRQDDLPEVLGNTEGYGTGCSTWSQIAETCGLRSVSSLTLGRLDLPCSFSSPHVTGGS